MSFNHPKIINQPFPHLETDRLLLEPLTAADEKEIFELHSDEKVLAFVDRSPIKTIYEARAFIIKITQGIQAGQWMYWKIRTKEDPTLVGTICLWLFEADAKTCDIGYELRQMGCGKGWMQEAAKVVLNYGFQELALAKIQAFTHQDNQKSMSLLRKLHFTIDRQEKQELVFSRSPLPSV